VPSAKRRQLEGVWLVPQAGSVANF